MKLFLTSSCISENLREPFLKFLGKPASEIKLYFIPTASDGDSSQFYTAKSMDDFQEIGINPIWYSLKFKTKEQIHEELADADVIWVNGGNTFYLLDVARSVGFIDVCNDLVRNKGVMYGGTSAGSILATPSIEIAGWGDDADPNDVGIQNLDALHFVNILTQVHYNPSRHKSMLLEKKSHIPIYAIEDSGAVEVNNGVITTHSGVEIFV